MVTLFFPYKQPEGLMVSDSNYESSTFLVSRKNFDIPGGELSGAVSVEQVGVVEGPMLVDMTGKVWV